MLLHLLTAGFGTERRNWRRERNWKLTFSRRISNCRVQLR